MLEIAVKHNLRWRRSFMAQSSCLRRTELARMKTTHRSSSPAHAGTLKRFRRFSFLSLMLLLAVFRVPIAALEAMHSQIPPGSRLLPDNPCELLTIDQASRASGFSVVTARRVPSIAEEVRAQREGGPPPAGNVCGYETKSDFGAIEVGMLKSLEPIAAKYWEARESYFRTFPGSAQSVPDLGMDAWIGGFTQLRLLVRDNLQINVSTQMFPEGSRGSSEVIVGVARAILRGMESRRF
jgi:hypothetical protein